MRWYVMAAVCLVAGIVEIISGGAWWLWLAGAAFLAGGAYFGYLSND